jgi:hypothetical protein
MALVGVTGPTKTRLRHCAIGSSFFHHVLHRSEIGEPEANLNQLSRKRISEWRRQMC